MSDADAVKREAYAAFRKEHPVAKLRYVWLFDWLAALVVTLRGELAEAKAEVVRMRGELESVRVDAALAREDRDRGWEEAESLRADCRTLEMRAAEAEALCLQHEGVIERLQRERDAARAAECGSRE